MFTGIIESMGEVVTIEEMGRNKRMIIRSEMTGVLRVDQSVSHNGVCLTVEELNPEEKTYRVSAIDETLLKTNLGQWRAGDPVNLERSLTLERRLDGHIVQGHIDGTVECIEKEDVDGSFLFTFRLPKSKQHLLIPQGSVALDGISLTVARLEDDRFSVAIIPYTLHHTTAGKWKEGSVVNIEYDVLGKYMERYAQIMKKE